MGLGLSSMPLEQAALQPCAAVIQRLRSLPFRRDSPNWQL